MGNVECTKTPPAIFSLSSPLSSLSSCLCHSLSSAAMHFFLLLLCTVALVRLFFSLSYFPLFLYFICVMTVAPCNLRTHTHKHIRVIAAVAFWSEAWFVVHLRWRSTGSNKALLVAVQKEAEKFSRRKKIKVVTVFSLRLCMCVCDQCIQNKTKKMLKQKKRRQLRKSLRTTVGWEFEAQWLLPPTAQNCAFLSFLFSHDFSLFVVSSL